MSFMTPNVRNRDHGVIKQNSPPPAYLASLLSLYIRTVFVLRTSTSLGLLTPYDIWRDLAEDGLFKAESTLWNTPHITIKASPCEYAGLEATVV